MQLHKRIIVVLICTCIFLSLSAQDRFSGEHAYEYIKELCKPEYEGRKTGFPSARQAAEWIGSKFVGWGLEPGGGNGSYIQEFPMLVTQQRKVSKLELRNGLFGPVEYQEGNDYIVYRNSGSGKIKAEVVFAGFGISEPEKGWDDYAGIDVQNKIALVYRGNPDDGQDWSVENDRNYRMNVAFLKGAAGLLVMSSRQFPVSGPTIRIKGYQPNLPAATVSRKLARDIFQGTMKNMDHTLEDLKKSPQSFATGKTMKFETVFLKIEPGVGENVLGIIPGSDPELKNEYIVVGGHMDHNGLLPSGHLYAGADDNASGTAVVMELARTLAESGRKLRRSVVFVGFGGEEQGLLGSLYFADYPTVPAEQICLMFNFDMEGQGDGGGSVGGRNYFPGIIGDVVDTLPDAVEKKLRVGRGWGFGGSDHAPFIRQGIPALGFHSTGRHPFYHRVEDNIESINVQSLQFVGNRAYELLLALGDYPSSLLYGDYQQGRTFTLFGDQMDIGMEALPRAIIDENPEKALATVLEVGMHAAVMDIRDWDESDESDLLGAADAFDVWIENNSDYLLRYKNSRTINQAAGSGKIAVALGLSGTHALDGNERLLRQLSKLGLNVLRIDSPDDSVFDESTLSEWGKKVLGTCGEEQLLLEICTEDVDLIKTVTDAHKGKAVIRVPWKQVLGKEGSYQNVVKNKNVFLVIECCPEAKAAHLSMFIDQWGVKGVHFSMLSAHQNGDDEEYRASLSAEWFFRLMQELYELRLENSDKQTVYEEMVGILGGSLKRFLQ